MAVAVAVAVGMFPKIILAFGVLRRRDTPRSLHERQRPSRDLYVRKIVKAHEWNQRQRRAESQVS